MAVNPARRGPGVLLLVALLVALVVSGHCPGCVDSDLGHGFEDIQEQIFGSAVTSAVTLPMSGFAQDVRGMGLGES
uniref:Uncharacterized protein n=1 Tax=Zea mays TaxID=4577 RepID=A0A804UGG7_MAIZE